MKKRKLCPKALDILLKVLPFITVAALFMAFYIGLADEFTLYAKKSFLFSTAEHIAAALCILLSGVLFTDVCLSGKFDR